jgi:hypothetical protein
MKIPLPALFGFGALLFFGIGVFAKGKIQSWCYFGCAVCMILAAYFVIFPVG